MPWGNGQGLERGSGGRDRETGKGRDVREIKSSHTQWVRGALENDPGVWVGSDVKAEVSLRRRRCGLLLFCGCDAAGVKAPPSFLLRLLSHGPPSWCSSAVTAGSTSYSVHRTGGTGLDEEG